MRTYISLVVLAVMAWSPLFAQQSFTFEHDGLTRDYILYTPPGLEENAPLVFVLHGYTSASNIIMAYSGMNAVANQNGFAVCYPQGTLDITGTTHWDSNLSFTSVDDSGFLASLAEYLQQTYNLDPGRTFSCGMSNGGFMSYTLACEQPEVFKAVASVTGTMSGYDWSNCGESPVPVLQISGSADQVVPVDGSMSTAGGWGGAPNIETVIGYWAEKLECSEASSSTIEANYTTTVDEYTGCLDDNSVILYMIDGWGHSWPTTFSGTGFTASEVIWTFFQSYKTQVTGVSTVDLQVEPIQLINTLSETSISLEVRTDYLGKPFELLDLKGNRHLRGVLSDSKMLISTEGLTSGYYLFSVEGHSKRFIKL